jgi:hypothetical protein
VEAALAAAEADREAAVEAKLVATVEAVECEAAERAAHWVAEMEKALVYRRYVDPREANRRAREHRLERHRTVRRQDAGIRAAMAAIDTVGTIGNGDGATLL